jgi:hypothetical protein
MEHRGLDGPLIGGRATKRWQHELGDERRIAGMGATETK